MLIRSQDKLTILNIEAITTIAVGVNGLTVDADTDGSTYTLGEYETIEKAIKVLDMIQEWYVDAVLTKCISSDMLRVFTKAEPSDLNMMIAEKVSSESLKRMCFQMPEDDEVK